ncbi:MFS transporter [Lactobacillus sp. S2-2]|uniref:MFS transporter n=1 Tax=Lactobacillus sp. S2-2 TaxID=2692917 RepID=UPI001F02B1CB|nr:MFS transporter [Lactobacillus sp. S2-2]MCF6515446.1 MFS transporter [Lactobacillus sp. S2-2]
MSKNKKILIVFAMCLGTFVSLLNETIMNIVLPEIQNGLHTNLGTMTWAINIYTILFASLTIPFGRLSERIGIHKSFIIGLLIFLFGAIIAAISTNINILILGRGIQALGVAFIFPLSMIIGISTVSDKKRPLVIALLAMTQGLAGALGPTIGGVLSEYLNWRWVFIINIPIIIITLIICFISLNFKEQINKVKIDILGSILSFVILISLTLGLIQGNKWHWNSLLIISLFITSLVSLFIFIWYENSIDHPMIPMKLFTYRQFNGASLSILISTVFFVGVLVVLPTYFVRIQNKSDLIAALLVTPASVLICILSPFSSMLVNKTGGKLPIILGTLSMGTAYILYWNIDMNNYISVSIACAFLGAGYGIIVGAMQALAAADFKGELLNSSQPVILVMRLVGFALAASIFITALNNNIETAKIDSIFYAKNEINTLKISSNQKRNLFYNVKKQINETKNTNNANFKINKTKRNILINKEINKLPISVRNKAYKIIANKVNNTINKQENKINSVINKIKHNSKKQFKSSFIKIYKYATPFVFFMILISFFFPRKKRN